MQFRNAHLFVVSLFLFAACGERPPSDSATESPATAAAVSQSEEAIDEANMDARTLTAQLEARKAQFVEMAPPERILAVESAVAIVTESNILDQAKSKGDKAPDFTLKNAVGDSVNLYMELAKGPVVLTWYRGSWCPYCNIQLHDYQKSLAAIRAAGAQLIAVSPELPDSALTWQEKNELEFIVLSDIGNDVAREYGIVYRIPDTIAAGYVQGGRTDLTKFNGDDSLELPLPVTYIIGMDGTIEYSFVDADYRKRAETSEVVDFVVRLANSANPAH